MNARLVMVAIVLGLAASSGIGSCAHSTSSHGAAGANSESAALVPFSDSDGAPASLLVDVDMGLDDSRVILALAMQDKFKVMGITTVEGSAGAEQGADNALRLLAALGVTDVPVATGATKTIDGRAIPAPVWRPMAESLGGLLVSAPSRPVEGTPAARFLSSALGASPGSVTILAIGPLTNLAQVLSESPTLAGKIHVVAMLGDFTQCTGYNCSADPVAAAIVRDSGVRMLMMMPSATDRLPFDVAFLARVQGLSGPAGQLVAKMMAHHSSGQMKLWDDSVLEALLEPEHFVEYAVCPGTVQLVDLDPGQVEQALLGLWNMPSPIKP